MMGRTFNIWLEIRKFAGCEERRGPGMKQLLPTLLPHSCVVWNLLCQMSQSLFCSSFPSFHA